MRDADNIRNVASLKPDYMGFIFYPHSRRFAGNLVSGVLKELSPSIRKTGVFVNASLDEIRQKTDLYELHTIQLHGTETKELCSQIKSSGVEVIKAFGIDEAFDFAAIKEYEEVVDYFLFDTRTSAHGGSGRPFDWNLLAHNSTGGSYFLSGGLDMNNIRAAVNIRDERLYAFDLNSRFETEPGLKDVEKLNTIFKHIRSYSARADKEDL